MGYHDKLNKDCKSVKIRTAVKKLKEGKTIRLSWGQTIYKLRMNGTEVWMYYPGLTWTKYGSLKEFRLGEYNQRFIEVIE